MRVGRLGGRVRPPECGGDIRLAAGVMYMASLSAETIAIGAAAAACAMAWAVFILAPAWTSYGRVWERVAASFLTLFILATLLGIGIVVGLVVVWLFTSNA